MSSLYGARKYTLTLIGIILNSVAALVLGEIMFSTYALANLLLILAFHNYNVKSKHVSFYNDSPSEEDSNSSG